MEPLEGATVRLSLNFYSYLEFEEGRRIRSEYQVALMRGAASHEVATAFRDSLFTETARRIYERYGFEL